MHGEHEVIAMSPGLEELFILCHFLILAGVIYFASKKGVLASLQSRHDAVRKRLVDSKHELDQTRHEIEKVRLELNQLEATKNRIVKETEEEGRKFSERLVQEAHVNAQRILADAKTSAEQEVRAAGDQLRQQLLREAVKQARTVLQGDGLKQAHETLVNKFLDDMSTGLSTKDTASVTENFDNGK